MRRSAWIFAFLISLATGASAQVVNKSAPTEDDQVWFDSQFTMPLRSGMDLTGAGGLRMGREVRHTVYERAGASVSFRVSRFFSISPSYNYVASQPFPGKDTREHRIAIDGILAVRLRGFEVSDRNRLERRILPTVDYSRYRNRLQLLHPLKIAGTQLSLQIADEIYYDGLLATWSRNRFSAGIGKRLNKTVVVEIYYLRQNDHYSKPGDIHGFGINLKSQIHRLF